MTTINATVAGARVVNAQQLASQMDGEPDWMAEVNSVTCPAGCEPGYGTFLISKSDYDAAWPTSGLFDIVLSRSGTTLTLKGYVTVGAQRALRAANSPYLVMVADARYLAKHTCSHHEYNVDGGEQDEWPDLLGDLTEDLPSAIDSSGLEFSSMPSYPLGRWMIDGRPTLEVLAELGARVGDLLTWNPIDGKLEYQAMSGSQTVPSAPEHRQYGVPETAYAHDLGGVTVSHEKDGTSETDSEDLPIGGGSSPGTAHAWGLLVVEIADEEDIEAERDALVQVWDDWSERRKAESITEYFGPVSIWPGSEVARVTWHIVGGEMFTMVEVGAPPPPMTYRSRFYQAEPLNPPHSFVVTDGIVPAAQFSQQLNAYIPGFRPLQRLHEFIESGLPFPFDRWIVPALDDDGLDRFADVWNSSFSEVEAGLHRLERIDGQWFLDTGGGSPGAIHVKITEQMPGARKVSDFNIWIPTILADQPLLVFDPQGNLIESGDTATVTNTNRDVIIPIGVHKAHYIGGFLCVVPPPFLGDVECHIKDSGKVVIPEDSPEICVIDRVHGLTDEFDVPPANENQSQTIVVTNPHNLPGWRLRCRYNYMADADPTRSWEVVSTNLTASPDGTFAVRLERAGGNEGSADLQCSFYYDVYSADEDEDPPRQLSSAYQPNDHDSDFNTRPNIGKMVEATSGIGKYINGEFRFLCLESVCAVAVDLSGLEDNQIPMLLEW